MQFILTLMVLGAWFQLLVWKPDFAMITVLGMVALFAWLGRDSEPKYLP